MKKEYDNIATSFCLNQRTVIPSDSSNTITFQVAGIVGAASAAFNCSRIYGGIVNRTACADPTPDPIIPFLQAHGNYSFVSAHPYSGLSNVIPAANLNTAFHQLSAKHVDNRCLSPMIGPYTSQLAENIFRSLTEVAANYSNEFRKIGINQFNISLWHINCFY